MQGTGALILGYHRVAERVPDPFSLCVEPRRFAAQLDELARKFQPSTLDSVFDPSPRRRVVVTFDDGYADNLWHALPIAQAKGVPITVFVTSGMIDSTAGMWWDRLAAICGRWPTDVPSVELSFPDGPRVVGIEGGPQRAMQTLHRQLLHLPSAEIDRLLDDLAHRLSVSSSAPDDARPLDSAELLELARSELVTVGAHTTQHLHLAGQPADEQGRQISGSKADLERRLDRSVDHFAYPFGVASAYDDNSVAAVREAGFETASTCLTGLADASTDRMRLPRRVMGNWGRARLRAMLARWTW
ncbi:MAG TPA: polysaccharide deacetylase family protein [Acidimicrobiales bacterium]|nr:polysaccharide deacetylase family protein [Acidimicrobiales bacterium]